MRLRNRLQRQVDETSNSRWGEAGTSLVEFALVLPIFAVLLFGLIDFGLIFGGYVQMRSGVEAGARLASVDQYQYTAATPLCSGGPDAATRQMVCNIAARIGGLQGVTSNSIKIGISFPSGGSQAVNSPVTVCSAAALHSTTGITSPFINGRTVSSSSTNRLEQAATYNPFNASSAFVTYNNVNYFGIAC